jgi:hypothetical protein
MLLLIASTAVASVPPGPRPADVQARATIRILRPAIANHQEWDLSPKASRKETIRKDDHGQRVLLRLIEYQ